MKIYTSRKVPDEEYSELEYYIDKICNKDMWLALKAEDYYYKWIRAYKNGDTITYSAVNNGAYYPRYYFYEGNEFGDRLRTDLTEREIGLIDCELVHPITILSTEELAEFISSEDDRYNFSDDRRSQD